MIRGDRPAIQIEEIEITPEMVRVGVLAGELEDFEYGWSNADELVSRVFAAMAAEAGLRLKPKTCATYNEGRI